MIASKARLSGDNTALSATLASNDPRKQKRLGRQVRYFGHEDNVLQGNIAKFS